ncbi:hypothetical protein [Bradyrhizobium sp. Ash2021]|uniref:hypothetical protein n=1 Tax=Bradyrhizobium sp. Ash2021 TaxID=2954771 RepID=UPI002816971F|nr:hypothetical protein [Bradyrhizobium sp. Ash2021]WMT71121.1 hypothetical protein NL528_23765 [Bradyrhizobium sp. Ash2021]
MEHGAIGSNVLPIIHQSTARAKTLQVSADAINDRGAATGRGGSWTPSNATNIITRSEG